MANATCLGVIIGNRDFFPDVLISEARRDLIKLFDELKIEPVWLSTTDSKLGAVETWADAQKCGELLGRNRGRIEGILVSLPNFGGSGSGQRPTARPTPGSFQPGSGPRGANSSKFRKAIQACGGFGSGGGFPGGGFGGSAPPG